MKTSLFWGTLLLGHRIDRRDFRRDFRTPIYWQIDVLLDTAPKDMEEMIMGGYFFGNIPAVKKQFHVLILEIILV